MKNPEINVLRKWWTTAINNKDRACLQVHWDNSGLLNHFLRSECQDYEVVEGIQWYQNFEPSKVVYPNGKNKWINKIIEYFVFKAEFINLYWAAEIIPISEKICFISS